jgi:riboflavin kinase/FMN adenylyltransferase
VAEGRRLGLHVFSTARVNLDGEPISSTGIRGLLAAGEMAAANARLGSPYLASGRVAPGKRLGRTLGFPTLNLPWAPAAAPRFGVYATRVAVEGSGDFRPAVANYGLRPTVEHSADPRLEVHVLGECPFGEGDAIEVEWLEFLRPERRFRDVAELSAQIVQDRAAAAAFFSRTAAARTS